MPGRKSVLTTGDVARICHVAPRTVSKWFDAGELRGYRIPGSKDRRIPVEQLVRFMRVHHIPLNGLAAGSACVLILDGDQAIASAMETTLNGPGGYEVQRVESAFEAGAAIREFSPDVFLVDLALPDVTATALMRFIHTEENMGNIRLIGTMRELSEADGEAILQQGFDAYLSKPCESHHLLQTIEAQLAEPSDVGPA